MSHPRFFLTLTFKKVSLFENGEKTLLQKFLWSDRPPFLPKCPPQQHFKKKNKNKKIRSIFFVFARKKRSKTSLFQPNTGVVITLHG